MTTWIEAAHQHIILDHVYKTKYVDLLQCDWLGICVKEQLNRCAYWSSQMWCTPWTDHESAPHIHIYGQWRSPTECFWTALEEARVTRESMQTPHRMVPARRWTWTQATMLVTVPPGWPISSANTIQKNWLNAAHIHYEIEKQSNPHLLRWLTFWYPLCSPHSCSGKSNFSLHQCQLDKSQFKGNEAALSVLGWSEQHLWATDWLMCFSTKWSEGVFFVSFPLVVWSNMWLWCWFWFGSKCKISNISLPSRKGTSLIPSCTRNFTPTLLHQRQRCFYGRNTIALTSTRVCSSSVAAAAWIDAIQAGKHEWQRWFINGADVCCIHAHVLTILDNKHTCKLRGRQQRLLPLRCTSLCRWVHKQTMKEWVKGRARGVIHHTTPCDSGQPYTETRHPHHRQTDI